MRNKFKMTRRILESTVNAPMRCIILSDLLASKNIVDIISRTQPMRSDTFPPDMWKFETTNTKNDTKN